MGGWVDGPDLGDIETRCDCAQVVSVDGRNARISNHDGTDGREKVVSAEGKVENIRGDRAIVAARAACMGIDTHAIRGFMVYN